MTSERGTSDIHIRNLENEAEKAQENILTLD
jgi:hypothetical protein